MCQRSLLVLRMGDWRGCCRFFAFVDGLQRGEEELRREVSWPVRQSSGLAESGKSQDFTPFLGSTMALNSIRSSSTVKDKNGRLMASFCVLLVVLCCLFSALLLHFPTTQFGSSCLEN